MIREELTAWGSHLMVHGLVLVLHFSFLLSSQSALYNMPRSLVKPLLSVSKCFLALLSIHTHRDACDCIRSDSTNLLISERRAPPQRSLWGHGAQHTVTITSQWLWPSLSYSLYNPHILCGQIWWHRTTDMIKDGSRAQWTFTWSAAMNYICF